MTDRILSMLRSADGFISGSHMSAECGITREAVRKHINKLKKAGYDIESVTNKGYRLVCVPSLVNKAEVQAQLETSYIGSQLTVLDKTDSTNAYIKRMQDELEDGAVVTAAEQTAGRGRLGRSWESERGGGLWFSVLLRPDMEPENISLITLAAGLAVCRAIGTGAHIKWPNDIVIGQKKVCGILTEMSAEVNAVSCVICGIGINVNTRTFDDELCDKATSLLLETGKIHDMSSLLARVLNELESTLDRLYTGGFESIIDEYRRVCITLGRDVLICRRDERYTAQALDVTGRGTLMVQTQNGMEEIRSGEVSVRGLLGYV